MKLRRFAIMVLALCAPSLFGATAIGPVVTFGVARSEAERGLFIALLPSLRLSGRERVRGERPCPFAGMTRIRFEGFSR